MQTAVFETTYPVMGAIKWHKSFYAQLASPLEVRDLANAMLMFTLFRVGSTCGVYFLVMAPFGVFAVVVGPGAGLAGDDADRHGVRHLDVRVQRPRPKRGVVRADLPARPDPAVPVLRARSSRSATSARSWSGSPGSRRCGTAST